MNIQHLNQQKNKKDSQMRKRFEAQFILGQLPIEETRIPLKKRNDSIVPFVAALKQLYITPEWNEKIFTILEQKILSGKKQTGRYGMNLWQVFVLAQFRLAINCSYDRLHHMANNDKMLRQLMGVETDYGFEDYEFEYQNILDNVGLLDDQTVRELNEVIVSFGHETFKKKETEALQLKTDSFVVESNVHFPTDYTVLWDCARKCLDIVAIFLKKYPKIEGWRKLNNWYVETKRMMRKLGATNRSGGKDKENRVVKSANQYVEKAKLLSSKISKSIKDFPLQEYSDLVQITELERFLGLLDKHIDLVERRLIKHEVIPHAEKMFSIFEQYTEWITKGKLHPNVELGKKLAITTDQFHLIVDYRIMENESDSEIVLQLAIDMLEIHRIMSWSFDKGFWHKDNKELLKEEISMAVMPKKGKWNQEERLEETAKVFVRLRNKHSAIESNINELEHCGLNRCPDRGPEHFKRYIGLAVIAYNLKRIGRKLLETARTEQSFKQAA